MKANFRTISHIFLIVASLLSLPGCFNTRFLKNGEVLFKNNKVTILPKTLKKENKSAFRKDLADISLLQPNKKALGIAKMRLWFYNVASKHKETKFRFWLKNKVGEPPVFFDSLQAQHSTELIQNYLINEGYFYATVNYEVVYKKKLATLNYMVSPGKVYTINNILYPEGDDSISTILRRHAAETKLKKGEPFRVKDLKAERERVADDLRNSGYFYFNKEYVDFNIDSIKGSQLLDLYVNILPPNDSGQHEVYYINNVYIYPDFSIDQQKRAVHFDTLRIGENALVYEYLKFRPDLLINAIHMKRDKLYTKRENNLTISQLADLGAFKFINVKFEPSKSPGQPGRHYLDCIIALTPAKKQDIGVDATIANNPNYLLGTSLALTYRHKNLFRGAELFEFNVTGSLATNFEKGLTFFNTVEFSTYGNLYFNKFLAPQRINHMAREYRPKSHISIKYDFLRRIDYYTVTTTNLTFGYDWKAGLTRKHLLNLVNISLVRVLSTSPAFDSIRDISPTLKNSFSEVLIFGSNYSYIWSNKALEKHYGYFFFRGDLEVAGNLLHGINSLARIGSHDSLPYRIFNVPYAQYVLIDGDVRNYFNVGKHSKLVTRLFGGIGYAYGNSADLPYVKQFFGGGTNDIRAWTVRTLGPGSFVFKQSAAANNNIFFYDQTGDLKLEANIELRFDIYKFLKGAIFTDAGNIWTLKADSLRPGANFDPSRFWKEFAIGSGIGLRLDFTYFVFRFDVAFPVRDPGVAGDRWVIKYFNPGDTKWLGNNVRLNLAIGYPF